MGNGGYSSIIMIVLMLVIFYLFLILPENKKKKKLNEMRSSLKVGDDIVTIGGMMGKVVHVTDDSVTFETSEDQVRIQVAKWAISTNARAEAQAADQAETVTHGDGARCQGSSGSQGCQAESKRSEKGRAEARGAEGPRGVKRLSE